MSDPTKLSDSDLIIAMGTHNDNCDCAHCREWETRRDAKADEPDEVLGGCGYEWDHTVPVGQSFCDECGAEIEEG